MLDTLVAIDESVHQGRVVEVESRVERVPAVAEGFDPFAGALCLPAPNATRRRTQRRTRMTKPTISVQLYSIHGALDADLDGSLGRLADIGLTTVEAFDFVRRADALKASFDRTASARRPRTPSWSRTTPRPPTAC